VGLSASGKGAFDAGGLNCAVRDVDQEMIGGREERSMVQKKVVGV